MICQPAIFVKGFPDARVSSSVILVYGVTIRWLHFAHAQSICTRPLDQKEVWPGDEASCTCTCTCDVYTHTIHTAKIRKESLVRHEELSTLTLRPTPHCWTPLSRTTAVIVLAKCGLPAFSRYAAQTNNKSGKSTLIFTCMHHQLQSYTHECSSIAISQSWVCIYAASIWSL